MIELMRFTFSWLLFGFIACRQKCSSAYLIIASDIPFQSHTLGQFQVVSALQGIAESETCHMTEDITPAISDSTIVPDINGSQGNC